MLWLNAKPLHFLIPFVAWILWGWGVQNFSSPRHLVIDTLVFVLATLTVVFVFRWRGVRRRSWMVGTLAVIGAWLIISATEPLFNHALSRNPSRFSRAIRVSPERYLEVDKPWQATSVGIALSGGGYRAAAYHAGVLDALDRLGVPIRSMSSISGGSIIGSFYSLGGDPLVFRNALSSGSFNLRRRMALAQNALRLPFPGFDRRVVQADSLRYLLDLGRTKEFRASCSNCPQLVLGSTDLNFGMQVGFLDRGLLFVDEANAWSQYHPDISGVEKMDLATRISISGAFPLAFPPSHIRISTLRQSIHVYDPGERKIVRSLVLADGGMSDNTGLILLRAAITQSTLQPTFLSGWSADFIIVSDASAIFGLGGDLGSMDSLPRAVDVISARGSQLSRKSQGRSDLIWLAPQRNFLPLPMLFNAPYSDLSPTTLANIEGYSWFNPFLYPDSILRALSENLLSDNTSDKKSLQANLERFLVARNNVLPYSSSVQASPGVRISSRLLPKSKDRKECENNALDIQELAANPRLRDLICDAVPLRQAFRMEISRLSVVFRDTSTLRDQLGESVTEDLFALGEAQALLSWPQLGQLLRSRPVKPSDPSGQIAQPGSAGDGQEVRRNSNEAPIRAGASPERLGQNFF